MLYVCALFVFNALSRDVTPPPARMHPPKALPVLVWCHCYCYCFVVDDAATVATGSATAAAAAVVVAAAAIITTTTTTTTTTSSVCTQYTLSWAWGWWPIYEGTVKEWWQDNEDV